MISGLTDLAATVLKTIDKKLQNITTRFAFLNDILIVTKSSLQDYGKVFNKIVHQLNDEHLVIDVQKSVFAKKTKNIAGIYCYATWSKYNKTKIRSHHKIQRSQNIETSPLIYWMYTSSH